MDDCIFCINFRNGDLFFIWWCCWHCWWLLYCILVFLLLLLSVISYQVNLMMTRARPSCNRSEAHVQRSHCRSGHPDSSIPIELLLLWFLFRELLFSQWHNPAKRNVFKIIFSIHFCVVLGVLMLVVNLICDQIQIQLRKCQLNIINE